MPCPYEGSLRAYLDGELSAAGQDALVKHLSTCQRCTKTLAELQGQAAWVHEALAAIPVPAPATRAAWYRFEARQRAFSSTSLRWRLQAMWQILHYRHWRTALAGAVLAAVLISVTAIAPLRATAARFLGIFRIQRFAVVQVNPGQLDRLESFQDQIFGEPEIDEVEPVDVDSVEQASELAGFQVLAPGVVPSGAGERQTFQVQGQRSARTEVNVAAARSLLEAAGLPTDALPQGLERMPIHATIPPGVLMEYGEGSSKVAIIQGRSPQVDVPDGVEMARLGEVGLQLLGMPPEQASRLSQSIDWATTLVVPVPADMGEVQEIQLRGTTGYVVTEGGSQRGSHAVVFWENAGIIYAVAGTLPPAQLVEIAESLK